MGVKKAIELINGEINQILNDVYLMRQDYEARKVSLENLERKINKKVVEMAELKDALERFEE